MQCLNHPLFNPLRKVALELGVCQKGQRNIEDLPWKEYSSIVKQLNDLPRGGKRLSQEGGWILAKALLTSKPISMVTFICITNYLEQRYRIQKGLEISSGENDILSQILSLRKICQENGLEISWKLVLADGWWKCFDENADNELIKKYCELIESCFFSKDLDVIKWSQIIDSQQLTYLDAYNQAKNLPIFKELVRRESLRRKYQYKLTDDKASFISEKHIAMRVAEGSVITEVFGPTIILSTETRGLRKFDNLIVPRELYNAVDYMPFYPHRI